MEKAEQNAREVFEFLRDHPKVERVGYLGFLDPDSEQGDIYARHCSGAGSTFSVIVGGEEKLRFLDALRLVKLAVSLGRTSLAASGCHDASVAGGRSRNSASPTIWYASLSVSRIRRISMPTSRRRSRRLAI